MSAAKPDTSYLEHFDQVPECVTAQRWHEVNDSPEAEPPPPYWCWAKRDEQQEKQE